MHLQQRRRVFCPYRQFSFSIWRCSVDPIIWRLKMNDSINSSIAWSINDYAFVLFPLTIALSVLIRFMAFSASPDFLSNN
jgi:hypothetical protein